MAISGLAKDMKKRLRELGCECDGYLAGVWRHQLPWALMWVMRGPSKRPPSYRAPSWSWASVDGIIYKQIGDLDRFRGEKHLTFSSVVNAECTPCGDDETGEVSYGAVTLKGPLAIAILFPGRLDYGIGYPKYIESLKSLGVGYEVRVIEKPEGVVYGNRFEVRFDVEDEMCDEVYCLPVESEHFSDGCWQVAGLALLKTDEGHYVRVGYFIMDVANEETAERLFDGFSETTCIIE